MTDYLAERSPDLIGEQKRSRGFTGEQLSHLLAQNITRGSLPNSDLLTDTISNKYLTQALVAGDVTTADIDAIGRSSSAFIGHEEDTGMGRGTVT